MKIADSWLREWLSTEMPAAELADELTRLGLEVDGLERVGPDLPGIVVGAVLEVRPHPNADRLRLCDVDTGSGEPLRVVCGAANVRAGGRYPLALEGARLPGGLEIRSSTLRGELSRGMLCSAVELALAESADGLLELDAQAPVGQPVSEWLGLDQTIIDVNLTPNRADCFSVLGLARDLAASLGLNFKPPRVLPVLPVSEDQLPVQVDAPAACPRFLGRVIRDLDPDAQTPAWMQRRLQACGIRPIHPVVDITNYVMLEYGQPMHGYDLERLDQHIGVRLSAAGDSLVLLDGQQVEPAPGTLLITDASGPVGLAGIMGGAGTAVSDSTRHVFLESAFFSPGAMAGRARALGLHTDASLRFERGVDPAHQQRAIERATALLLDIAGGCPGPAIEIVQPRHLPARPKLHLRRARLAALLGTEVPDTEVRRLLSRLDLKLTDCSDGWDVTPPPARFDLNIEADLIEEVARLHGYDRIPETPGLAPTRLGRIAESAVTLERARLTLVERGYQEAITYSFGDPDLDAAFAGGQTGARLSNPISSALAVMRQSLWPGLAQALCHNLSRQQDRVRLFEAGVRFIVQGNEINEELVISALAYGSRLPEQWGDAAAAAAMDVFDIKADLDALIRLGGIGDAFRWHAGEHAALRPGRSAELRRGDLSVGWIGELHPVLVRRLELNQAPLLFEVKAAPLLAAERPVYRGLSRFPAVRRDLAVVVPVSVAAGELEAAVRQAGGDVLRDVVIFDVYAGNKVETGSKSVALGLILQDTSRTLNDADVDGLMRKVTACLSREFNATIRE